MSTEGLRSVKQANHKSTNTAQIHLLEAPAGVKVTGAENRMLGEEEASHSSLATDRALELGGTTAQMHLALVNCLHVRKWLRQ